MEVAKISVGLFFIGTFFTKSGTVTCEFLKWTPNQQFFLKRSEKTKMHHLFFAPSTPRIAHLFRIISLLQLPSKCKTIKGIATEHMCFQHIYNSSCVYLLKACDLICLWSYEVHEISTVVLSQRLYSLREIQSKPSRTILNAIYGYIHMLFTWTNINGHRIYYKIT